jgi:N-acetylneuraminic acid mutarotase
VGGYGATPYADPPPGIGDPAGARETTIPPDVAVVDRKIAGASVVSIGQPGLPRDWLPVEHPTCWKVLMPVRRLITAAGVAAVGGALSATIGFAVDSGATAPSAGGDAAATVSSATVVASITASVSGSRAGGVTGRTVAGVDWSSLSTPDPGVGPDPSVPLPTPPGLLPTPSPAPSLAAVLTNLAQAVDTLDPSSLPPSVVAAPGRFIASLPPANVPGVLEFLNQTSTSAVSGLGVSIGIDPPVALPSPVGGTWGPTGNLNDSRGDYTLTRLKDGRVLAAGGNGYDGTNDTQLVSCEIYDPHTGSWSRTGDLATGRVGQTADLLPDGRVVVFGGNGVAGPVESVEIFDPATGRWSGAGTMPPRLTALSTAVLTDGRVLLVGGVDAQGGAQSDAEIYDPGAHFFSPVQPLHHPRVAASATPLPDGTVLVAGGWVTNAQQGTLSSTEIYHPAANTWTDGPSMSFARSGHTATLLTVSGVGALTGHGKVVVTGGTDGYGPLAATEVYDTVAQTWQRVGDPPQARSGDTATALADGRLLITGGYGRVGNTWTTFASSELFDPATGRWTTGASMAIARSGHGAAQLPDGRVVVAGGYPPSTGSTLFTASSELLTLPY